MPEPGENNANEPPIRRVPAVMSATVLGMAAFALVLAVTDPPGPGLDPDAMAYMGAAESVAAHGDYRIPAGVWSGSDSTGALAHFPPGYSTLIALPVRLGFYQQPVCGS